jgi:hypothetical protein
MVTPQCDHNDVLNYATARNATHNVMLDRTAVHQGFADELYVTLTNLTALLTIA